jgi:DNA-directed RNA polymerase subunit beta'
MSDLLVTDGEAVTKGQQLSVGSIDPKEMLKLRTPLEAQDYIIEQVQNVYSIQGLDVDDRHLEIVTRQMCRYALISDTGDSDAFLAGDYIDVIDMEYENLRLKQKGLKPIKGDRVLLGITNSSLRTESFLSAASFEQQVRVLTEAALVGKVDHLRGLKENVIIGRPVPLGELLINKNHSELEEVRVRVEALNEAKISLN